MDKSDFVCSFLDAHNNACAYCDGWSSPVGDRIDDCADDRRHHRLRVHRRAHLPCRRSDVRTEARPGATGQAGTYEISWRIYATAMPLWVNTLSISLFKRL